MSVQTRAVLSAILFATGLWLFLIYLLRYTLKALLSYHGWIFESHGKMSTSTKVWLVSARIFNHTMCGFEMSVCQYTVYLVFVSILGWFLLESVIKHHPIYCVRMIFWSCLDVTRAWWRCSLDADHCFTVSRPPYPGFLCQVWMTLFAGCVTTQYWLSMTRNNNQSNSFFFKVYLHAH